MPRDAADTSGDPWRIHLFFTTDGRRSLHYFAPESAGKIPTAGKRLPSSNAPVYQVRKRRTQPDRFGDSRHSINSTKYCGIDQIERLSEKQQYRRGMAGARSAGIGHHRQGTLTIILLVRDDSTKRSRSLDFRQPERNSVPITSVRANTVKDCRLCSRTSQHGCLRWFEVIAGTQVL